MGSDARGRGPQCRTAVSRAPSKVAAGGLGPRCDLTHLLSIPGTHPVVPLSFPSQMLTPGKG